MIFMSFKNGYLGVLVLIIALVATICGSWVLSMDVTEKESTQYNYLTELTGLFSTEQAPQYIEYNPSTNYTGYYTAESTIGENHFFDGVNYEAAANPNSYRIQGIPLSSTIQNNYDLDDLNPTDTVTVGYFAKNIQQPTERVEVSDANTMTMQEIATALGYTGGNVRLIIKNIADPADYDDLSGYMIFYDDSMKSWSGQPNKVWIKNPTLTGTLYQYVAGTLGNAYVTTADRVSNPVLAAVWDGSYVTMYYDVECTQTAGIFSPDQVSIAWGGTSGTANFSDLANIEFYALGNPEYMDISKGVSIREE